MTPAFLEIDSIRLCYYEQNKEASSTIFFLHGNSASSNTWRKQFNSSLLKDYRLVAIDLPAHGKSRMSENPAGDYSLPGLALIMMKAVNQLRGNKPYMIAAISLATNVLAEMLSYSCNPSGIVLAGPCITGPGHTLDIMIKKGADASAVFMENAPEEHVVKYALATSSSREPEDLEAFLKDYHDVKGPFRSTLFSTITAGEYNDQILLLNKAGLPMLGVFGLDEEIIDNRYLDNAPLAWWNNRIYMIPGASHLVNIDRPEEFNNLLLSFARDVFK